jgi:hypothetical protein
MQIPRDTIESSLPKKGFVKEDSHHRYFHHEYKGKITGAYAYTSHGSKYKTYPEPLLKQMKKPLFLDRVKDVKDLFLCPIDGDDYNQILREKGLIKEQS